MSDLPIQPQQSQQEFEYMARLQQERARDRQSMIAQEVDTQYNERQQRPGQPTAPQNATPFPMGMFCWAVLFDLIGLIPFVNFISELIAGFIFGFWQKRYIQKTNPLATFVIAKIVDTISTGILPSNIGIVVFAYSRKKMQNVV